jgi:HK97 family phage major capsid protein
VSIANIAAAVLREDKAELGFARSVSARVGEATGQTPQTVQSYLVPADALGIQKRDLTVSGGGAAGAYLVDSTVPTFAASLRAASVTLRLPMLQLTQLRADATIATETVRATAGWALEGVAAADANPTFGALALTPHTLCAKLTVSRQLILQAGPSLRPFLDGLMAAAMAEALDAALLDSAGTGGAPTGLKAIAGINSRAGTSYSLSDAAAMLRVVEGFADSDSIRWVAGVGAAETLRKRERAAGSGTLIEGRSMLGVDVLVSRGLSANQLAIAPWSTIVFGAWGGLEIAVDPYTDFQSGKVSILARWLVDFGPLRPAQFAIATAVT